MARGRLPRQAPPEPVGRVTPGAGGGRHGEGPYGYRHRVSAAERNPQDVVVYSLDPRWWSSASGAVGLPALVERLGHLAALGVSHVWVLPFHPSGGRDGGYDVVDHAAVDPDLGTLDDFDRLVVEARARGIGVLVDLVSHHTSDQHRWFVEARRDPTSRRGRYYLWTRDPESEPPMEPMFPTEDSVWAFEERAQAWYRHAFYDHQPDLDHANPDVVGEIERVMRYWLSRGAAGFRLDALPLTARQYGSRGQDAAHLFRRLRRVVEEERPGGLLLAETNVPADELPTYFDRGRGLTHLLTFWLTDHLFLALARQEAEPVLRGLDALAPPPHPCTYAHFLRNHDELALEQVTDDERSEVLDALAPDPEHRVFGGARRRLHGLLGDVRRTTMAQVLLLSLPGATVLLYGDELAAVEDLSRPGRRAVRVPMPWGRVEDPGVARLLDVTARAVRVRRALHSSAPRASVDAPHPAVVRVRLSDSVDAVLLANLSGASVTVAAPTEQQLVLGDGESVVRGPDVQLAPYGFAWFAEAGPTER